MPTPLIRRLSTTEIKDLSPGHSDPRAESGLESSFPLGLAVPETVLRPSCAPLNQEQLMLFPKRNLEIAGVTVLGPCGLGKDLNHSSKDGAHFSLCLIRSGHQRLQQGACLSSTHTSFSQVTAPPAAPSHI